MSILPSLSTSSSLLFTIGSSGEKQRKSYKMGPGFGSNRLQPKLEASDEGKYRKGKSEISDISNQVWLSFFFNCTGFP